MFGEHHPMRHCERCDATADNTNLPDPLCMEVQLAFGILAWLCHDCRKEWHRVSKILLLQKEYSIASLKFEFWQNTVGPETPEHSVDKGIALFKDVHEIELEINEFATKWLSSISDQTPDKTIP